MARGLIELDPGTQEHLGLRNGGSGRNGHKNRNKHNLCKLA